MLKSFLRGPWVPAIIVVCVIAATLEARSATRSEGEGEEAPAPDVREEEVRAFLGGLAVGDVIEDGWEVTQIRGPAEGRIAVVLDRNGAIMEVGIVRKGTVDANPPFSTERFDLFYSMEPQFPPITPESLRAGVQGLGDRIAEDPAIPEGM